MLTLEVLPYSLELGSIKERDIAKCMHSVIKLSLFSDDDLGICKSLSSIALDRNIDQHDSGLLSLSESKFVNRKSMDKRNQTFFSFSKTPAEYSIIIETRYLNLFPFGCMKISGIVWKPLLIGAGENQGIDYNNIAHIISEPLARNNISIFQVSTYEADFTLVPERDLLKALDCLSDSFEIIHTATTNGSLHIPDSIGQSSPAEATIDISLEQKNDVSVVNHNPHLITVKNRGLSETASCQKNETTSLQDQTLSNTSLEVDNILDSIQKDPVISDNPVGFISSQTNQFSLTKSRSSESDISQMAAPIILENIPFTLPVTDTLLVASIREHVNFSLLFKPLIQLMFYSTTDTQNHLHESERKESSPDHFNSINFFSFTKVNGSCSLIIPEHKKSLFPPDSLNTWAGVWRTIRIGDDTPLGFDASGIVASFTRPLEIENIAVCYLSTFMSDFIILLEDEFEDAINALEKRHLKK